MLLLVMLGVGGRAAAQNEAAEAFTRGKALYNEGRFREAITSFEAAQRESPHQSTLFNIARCHENLGEMDRAFTIYQQARTLAQEPSARENIEQRLRRLRELPVKVFVNSVPPGARVTVNGRAAPETRPTPLLLKLVPGDHLLLFRREGFQLEARRVEVQVGQEQTINQSLRNTPACPPPAPRCPEPTCSPAGMADFSRMRLQLGVMGIITFARGWGLLSGVGIRSTTTFRNFFIGGQVHFYPVSSRSTEETDDDRLFMAYAEGGWFYPLKNFFLYVSGAAGGYIHTVEPQADFSKRRDAGGFSWNVASGISVMATRWLSLGTSLRFGVMHGDRVDTNAPSQLTSDHHFPYGTWWTNINFHLDVDSTP